MRETWHSELIGAIVRAYAVANRPPIYVEVGVLNGVTVRAAQEHAHEVHAVDPEHVALEGVQFWHMPSDEFWPKFEGHADIVFIDGDHRADQVERDLHGALRILSADGLILMHDTWPEQENDTTTTWDAWKVAEKAERARSLAAFTFPLWPGLTLVRPFASRFG